MKNIDTSARKLHSACLSAKGAYHALKTAGLHKILPGYHYCVTELEDAIKYYEDLENENTSEQKTN